MPATGWRPIVDSGGPGGLQWTSLAEVSVGEGRILLCQMHLIEKLETELVAQLMLENLRSYAAQQGPMLRPTALRVLPAQGAVADRIRALGFTVAGRGESDVTVIDATAPPSAIAGPLGVTDIDAAVETLIQQIRHGNVVVLHGLTADNIQNWPNSCRRI